MPNLFTKCAENLAKILLIEPFFAGSHRQWAESLQQHSHHELRLLTLRGKYWKWRMYGGAVELAKRFLEMDWQPDLLLVTDMLDVATFLGLTRRATAHLPVALYFHENQLTYPWSPDDADAGSESALQYAFINYSAALAADVVCFNSDYHHRSFLGALPDFLGRYPDVRGLHNLAALQAKSRSLYLGLGLQLFDPFRLAAPPTEEPVVLWNHRWEFDKDPDAFFALLYRLDEEGIPFRLVVLGESYARSPKVFEEARLRLRHRILHFGYAASFSEYARWLCTADVLLVTNRQDFFGASIVEAIYCGAWPILPRRLSYPELVEEESCFYDSEEEAYTKLKKAVLGVVAIRESKGKRAAWVSRFDWRQQINAYDCLFDDMLKNL